MSMYACFVLHAADINVAAPKTSLRACGYDSVYGFTNIYDCVRLHRKYTTGVLYIREAIDIQVFHIHIPIKHPQVFFNPANLVVQYKPVLNFRIREKSCSYQKLAGVLLAHNLLKFGLN